MLSVNMKSAVCDCKIPDPCIHKLTLKVGKRVFIYNQIEPIGDIWVVDESDGIPVAISLVGKRCYKVRLLVHEFHIHPHKMGVRGVNYVTPVSCS
ncbi:hypothetical protein [Photorhabdus temperata]|uniref:Uncharacterized protein n=1 Tax=Photorhabdus temperata subsp. temperata Meg1 TaxID=1393735 RepID=A0A081RQJ8_PHOTE|nr:hypothetical protein [Photorhabdus temperata]KER00951.1 hypothetical protein MEG1DRAFT_04452 [Photorhabdus temperata subsp. temperata Meg1]